MKKKLFHKRGKSRNKQRREKVLSEIYDLIKKIRFEFFVLSWTAKNKKKNFLMYSYGWIIEDYDITLNTETVTQSFTILSVNFWCYQNIIYSIFKVEINNILFFAFTSDTMHKTNKQK